MYDQLETRVQERTVELAQANQELKVEIAYRKNVEARMLESQKLAAIGTLAAGIAHEINSPLQVITGHSESLQRRQKGDQFDPAILENGLESINRNAWRVAEIVRSLLSYARPSLRETETVDLNSVVDDALLLIKHRLETWSNIQVQRDFSSDLPDLQCDRNQISQVVINLVNNAADALPDGGKIIISTRYHPTSEQLVLQVSDNGTGIAEEIQNVIFDPFFTTKQVGKGTGLGLSIVKGITQAHNGEITLESKKRETRFTIRLPLKQPRFIPPAEIQASLGRYT